MPIEARSSIEIWPSQMVRADNAYHMNSFDCEFRSIRVSVQPGITGMWQVSSRSNGDLQVQKAQDLFYIRNWSIWLDIYLLLQTVIVVLNGRGAK
jgi:lipopolysaccharide/colanic/teichoic acid biosynthesis glycosyltransferase